MWSPSSTNLWLECPLKWSLRRQGVPEVEGRWHPAQLVGTALHKGWGTYLDPTKGEKSLVEASLALVGALSDGWSKDTRDWQLAQVESLALKCLKKVIDTTLPSLLDDGGSVLAVESDLGIPPSDNSSRSGRSPNLADLITSHGYVNDRYVDNRYLVVTDYKTHWTVSGDKAARYLSQTERSWQLTQYAYFAQGMFQLPVKYTRSVHVAVTPSPKAWVYTCPVTQKRLDRWREFADSMWAEMDVHDLELFEGSDVLKSTAWPNWDSCEKYGANFRCGFYDRCHGGS